MKDLLKQFVVLFDTYDEYQRRLDAYQRVLKTEEWKFLRDTFVTLKATILSDMLSAQYTKLDEREKDVMQRTYYNINLILDFLSEPKKWIQYRSRWNSVVDKIQSRALKVRQKGNDHAGRDNT
jgi:hypothetical protein